jgi:hypothetical protein
LKAYSIILQAIGTRRLAKYILLAGMLLTSAYAQQQAPKQTGSGYVAAEETGKKILIDGERDYRTIVLNMDGAGEYEFVTIFNHPRKPDLREAYDRKLLESNNELFGSGGLTVEVYNGLEMRTRRVIRHKGIRMLEWRCGGDCGKKIGDAIGAFLQRMRDVNVYSEKLERELRAELKGKLNFDAVFFHDGGRDTFYLLSHDPKGGIKVRDIKSISGKMLGPVFIEGNEL